MTEPTARPSRLALALCALIACLHGGDALAQARPTPTELAASRAADRSVSRPGDYIVAVVNQELVTAVEVEQRLKRVREEAQRSGRPLPTDEQLHQQILDGLIEERVILTFSRDMGGKVDDAEIDRAVQMVATQNQLSVEQLRARLQAEGIDYGRFRANLQDQMLVERTREREVYQRIRITDGDIDRLLEQQRAAAAADTTVNLAQILVSVPEGASEAVVAERRARADAALARVRAGEPFDAVARELSEDANRQRGGEIGPRPSSRLPDLFVEATKGLKAGELAAAPVRSGAGFHVLKVIARDDVSSPQITQTRARHILLRPSARLTAEQAAARLADYKRQIESGRAKFEDLARQFSEDGSAAQGGELGWASPGVMVPEFEEAMARLANGGLSDPVGSRFGVHLIQVLERRQITVDPKQLREQARNTLREQKFETAYTDWVRELRGNAYIEMREPPQ